MTALSQLPATCSDRFTVGHVGRVFFATDSTGRRSWIRPENLSPELRGMDAEGLAKCLNVGRLTLSQSGDAFALRWDARICGGGPISGLIAYWATKAVCYGTATAAVTGAIVATGGAAAGAAASLAGGALGTASGVAAGAGAVAGAIGASAAATAAATEITAATVGGAGLAATVAAVESASLGVGAFFTAIPFLP